MNKSHKFNLIQENAYRALRKYQKKNSRGVIVMPTGSGKTFLTVKWIGDIVKKEPDVRVLFVAHSLEILEQAKDREFKKRLDLDDSDCGLYINKEKNVRQFTFATIQTLSRHLNKFNPKDFDYVILDECHHAQSVSYRKVVEYFEPRFLLGLTATPHRMDGRDITEILGEIFFVENANVAIDKGIISSMEYWCVDNDIDFSNIQHNGTQYSEKDFNKKIGILKYDKAILKEYKNHVKKEHGKKKTIAFCSTVKHARRLSRFFSLNGVNADCLVSEDSKDKPRKDIVDGFRDGDTEIIFVRDIFNEGVDIPEADCAMLLRPTESHTVFNQQVGRVLRKKLEKKYALILDFSGNAERSEANLYMIGSYANLDIIEEIKKKKYHFDRNKELIIIKDNIKIRISRAKFDLVHRYLDNLPRTVDDAIIEFQKIYGETKPKRTDLARENKWIHSHFYNNGLLGEFCQKSKHGYSFQDAVVKFKEVYGNTKPSRSELRDDHFWIHRRLHKRGVLDKYCQPSQNSHRNIDDAMREYKKKYGKTKPKRFTLRNENNWIHRHFEVNKLLDKYCQPRIRSHVGNLDDAIKEFRKVYGKAKPTKSNLYIKRRWVYRLFDENELMDKYCQTNLSRGLGDAVKEFKKIYGSKKPRKSELNNDHQWICSHFRRNDLLDKYCENKTRDALKEFKKIYGRKKPLRSHLERDHKWIYVRFFKNKLLDKYCKLAQTRKGVGNKSKGVRGRSR